MSRIPPRIALLAIADMVNYPKDAPNEPGEFPHNLMCTNVLDLIQSLDTLFEASVEDPNDCFTPTLHGFPDLNENFVPG